jgi:hypothetical protein
MQVKYIGFIITAVMVAIIIVIAGLWYTGVFDFVGIPDAYEDYEGELRETEDDEREDRQADAKINVISVTNDIDSYKAANRNPFGWGEDPEEVESGIIATCVSNRAYIMSGQDGTFLDIGGGDYKGIEKEWGGVWALPIKLLDGFWLEVRDLENGQSVVLNSGEQTAANTYINYPYADEFEYNLADFGLEVTRFQFCVDDKKSVVVNYKIEDTSGRQRNLTANLFARTELMFDQGVDEEGLPIEHGEDKLSWDGVNKAWVASDTSNKAWSVVFGSGNQEANPLNNFDTKLPETFSVGNKSTIGAIEFSNLNLEPNKSISLNFVVAGSDKGEDKAKVTYKQVKSDWQEELQRKKQRYQKIVNTSKIEIPDIDVKALFNLAGVYDWTKFHIDWLVHTQDLLAPTWQKRNRLAPARGLFATYPRFRIWFGIDSTRAVPGIIASGRPDLARDNLQLLAYAARERNPETWQVPTEVTAGGFIPSEGESNQTQDLIMAIWTYYNWTGDATFLTEMWPFVDKGLTFLQSPDFDVDEDLLLEGHGNAEQPGYDLEMIDSATFSYGAFNDGAQIIEELVRLGKLGSGKLSYVKDLRANAESIKEKIENDFWIESEGVYGDMMASPFELSDRIEDIIIGNEEGERRTSLQKIQREVSGSENTIQKAWSLLQLPIIYRPMEIIPGLENGRRALDHLKKIEGFGFEDNGSMAMAEARYGDIDRALLYVTSMADGVAAEGFSLTQPEILSAYAMFYPIVNQIFGIQPEAHKKKIVIRPQIPKDWKNMKISNVPVGNALVDVSMNEISGVAEYIIDVKGEGWTADIDLASHKGVSYVVNGERLTSAKTTINF